MRRTLDWLSGLAVGVALTLVVTATPDYHFEQAPGRTERMALAVATVETSPPTAAPDLDTLRSERAERLSAAILAIIDEP